MSTYVRLFSGVGALVGVEMSALVETLATAIYVANVLLGLRCIRRLCGSLDLCHNLSKSERVEIVRSFWDVPERWVEVQAGDEEIWAQA